MSMTGKRTGGDQHVAEVVHVDKLVHPLRARGRAQLLEGAGPSA